MKERLQKVMARRGYGSRRTCEDMIRAGRVLVNGAKPSLGDKVDPARDEVMVDGRQMDAKEELLYVLLNKPPGYLSSTRSQGGLPTVLDLVSTDKRIYPVGRLDLESEGLLLLTNDGPLTQRLTHPRYKHEKEYLVLVDQLPSQDQLDHWSRGVILPDGYRTKPARVAIGGEADGGYEIKIVMTEGRKRQIREIASTFGLHVQRLVRVRMANLQLGELPTGKWRQLARNELESLKRNVGETG
jgi:23S rRNA pseudouridine2605 synthase